MLLIENRVPIEIGSRKVIGLPADADADSTAITYKVRLRAKQLSRPHAEAEYTLMHEFAHSIDRILGDHLRLKGQSVMMGFSELYDEWTTRFNEEMKRPKAARQEPVFRELQELIQSPIYSNADQPSEGFAFLVAHYFMQYFRSYEQASMNQPHAEAVNEDAIHRKMEQDLPKLWPYFRDTVLPLAKELAGEQYHHRREREARAAQKLTRAMQEAINTVCERYGCARPSPESSLAERLATSHGEAAHYFPDWHSLFLLLASPAKKPQEHENLISEEKSMTKKLQMFFPSIFDPMWGAPLQPRQFGYEPEGNRKVLPSRHYTIRSFPELRKPAEALANDFSEIIRDEGIEKFVEHYDHLLKSFEDAIALRKSKAPNR